MTKAQKHLPTAFAALTATLALAVGCGATTQSTLRPAPPDAPAPQKETAKSFVERPKSIAAAPEVLAPTTGQPPSNDEAPPQAPHALGRASITARARLPEVTPAPLVEVGAEYRRWTELARLEVGHSHLSHLDISPDERYVLAVSESEGAARVYALETQKLVFTSPIVGYAPYERGDFLFWPASFGDSPPSILVATKDAIALLDPSSGARQTLVQDRGAYHMKWSDDKKILMASLADIPGQTSTLEFFQASEKRRALETILSLTFDERVDGFDLSPDGRRLAVSYYPSDSVEMLDLRDGRLLWRRAGPEFAGAIDISPDGRFVAVGGKHLFLYDAQTGERLGVFEKLLNNIHQVTFSPSGDALAVTAYDGRVRILSTRFKGPTLPKLKILRHQGIANVYEAVFTADGTRLLTGSGDQTIRIWGSPRREGLSR